MASKRSGYQSRSWFVRFAIALLVLLPVVLVLSALLSLTMNALFYRLWDSDVQICEGCPVFPVKDFLMFWGYTGMLGLAPALVTATCAAVTRLRTSALVFVSAVCGPLLGFLPSLLILNLDFDTLSQSILVLSGLMFLAAGAFWFSLATVSRSGSSVQQGKE